MKGVGGVRALGRLLLGAALLLGGGCDGLPGRPQAAAGSAELGTTAPFDALYGQWCSGCHGADGTFGAARPLADPVYLGLVGDDVLRRVTSEGVPGSLMPGFGRGAGGALDAAQVEVLVRGIRQRWGNDASGVPRSRPAYAIGDAPPGDPAHGRRVYVRRCRGCHGDGGRGGPHGGSIVDPAYLSLVSDQALRTAVLAGRPDLGMPDWRGESGAPLTTGEISDVVAWLASQRPAPAPTSSPDGAAGSDEKGSGGGDDVR